ncbi:MAG: FHA domain-containing protein, partial [Ancalomicrobiaceae bacterium]|nr:FHA domain-containing protein [Ancalomicrobiaceae bacterium]
MALHLRIENETTLPDGGPIEIRVTGRRGIDIGRDNHLDWTLPDPTRYISGKHCEVRYEKGEYILYDVSTNGTFINGGDRRMKGPHRLQTGDRIIIGNYIVAVDVDGSDLDGPALRPASAAGHPANPWDAVDAAPPVERKDVMVPKDRGPMPDPLDWYVEAPEIQRQEPGRPPSADPYFRDAQMRPDPRPTSPTNPGVWDSPSIGPITPTPAPARPAESFFGEPAAQVQQAPPPPPPLAPSPAPQPYGIGMPGLGVPGLAPSGPAAPGTGAPAWPAGPVEGPVTRAIPKPANRAPKTEPTPQTGNWQDMMTEPPPPATREQAAPVAQPRPQPAAQPYAQPREA